MLLGIFKISLRLRDCHVFITQWLGILNVFNSLTLKQILCETKVFLKDMEYRFLVESTKIENGSFPLKNFMSELNLRQMLRQIQWLVQNGPITKNEVLPVTTLSF